MTETTLTRRLVLLLALVACALPALAQQGSTPAHKVPPRELVAELRKGGYVLYFRHVATDFSKNDEKMRDYDDCDNQRLLIDSGRADARRIGAAFTRRGIPVGPVYANPFCRTVETAQIIFGRYEKMQEVRGGPLATNDPNRYKALLRIMSTPPEAGRNLVISSHGNPFQALVGSPYLAEGEMAVIKPLGERFEVFARVRVEDWTALTSTSP